MAVKIRLKRIGRKKQPSYRIVVAESRNPRGGKVVETIGHYNPYNKDKNLVLDLEKVDYWKSKGAKPSEAVIKLIRRSRKIADGTLPAKAEPKSAPKVEEAKAETVEETPAVDAVPEEAPVEETPAEDTPSESEAETETETPAE